MLIFLIICFDTLSINIPAFFEELAVIIEDLAIAIHLVIGPPSSMDLISVIVDTPSVLSSIWCHLAFIDPAVVLDHADDAVWS